MATKLKKRKPVLTFFIFFIAFSTLLMTLLSVVEMVWENDLLAADYKQSDAYRMRMARLIQAGYQLTLSEEQAQRLSWEEFSERNAPNDSKWDYERAKVSLRSSYDENNLSLAESGDKYEYAASLLAREGRNISYFFVAADGTIRQGNTEAQTPDAFIAEMQSQLQLARGSVDVRPSSAGYDHLVVVRGGQFYEEMNTHIGVFASGGAPNDTKLLTMSSYGRYFGSDYSLMDGLSENDTTLCIAVRAEGAFVNNYGSIYTIYYQWFQLMIRFIAAAVLSITSLVFLLGVLIKHKSFALAAAGIASFTGKIWVEAKLLLVLFTAFVTIVSIDQGFLYRFQVQFFCLVCFWSLWLVANDIKRNKMRFFSCNSIHAAVRFLHSLESCYPFCERMKRRLVIWICAEAALLFLLFLFPWFMGPLGLVVDVVVLAFAVVLLVHYIYTYNRNIDIFARIVGYVAQIRAGTAVQPLVVPPDSDFASLAADLNDIHSGMVRMVDERVRSQRMKVELITNVSHDLKTPLTSIINYIDLLGKEALSPDFANDYVKVIASKSERLKNLVQDLFEISKANSGEADLNLEQLNIASLLEQTAAELDERGISDGVEVRLQCAQPHIVVRADGKKLHRVFENLLGNALKYALNGTRVYVSARTIDSNAEISFKNVSSYEMNFTPEEIVERFQRGDASRASDGSGLGLAIAKSFLELNGGNLQIELDGDLFKAIVTMPLYVPYAERNLEECPEICLEKTSPIEPEWNSMASAAGTQSGMHLSEQMQSSPSAPGYEIPQPPYEAPVIPLPDAEWGGSSQQAAPTVQPEESKETQTL